MSLRTCCRAFAAALLATAFAPPATAAGAEICYSAEQPSGSAPPTNSTTFTCPSAGSGSVVQLAARGLRIISLRPLTGTAPGTIRQQLTVQIRTEIHRDGFE